MLGNQEQWQNPALFRGSLGPSDQQLWRRYPTFGTGLLNLATVGFREEHNPLYRVTPVKLHYMGTNVAYFLKHVSICFPNKLSPPRTVPSSVLPSHFFHHLNVSPVIIFLFLSSLFYYPLPFLKVFLLLSTIGLFQVSWTLCVLQINDTCRKIQCLEPQIRGVEGKYNQNTLYDISMN